MTLRHSDHLQPLLNPEGNSWAWQRKPSYGPSGIHLEQNCYFAPGSKDYKYPPTHFGKGAENYEESFITHNHNQNGAHHSPWKYLLLLCIILSIWSLLEAFSRSQSWVVLFEGPTLVECIARRPVLTSYLTKQKKCSLSCMIFIFGRRNLKKSQI